jgi:hypothetical protein
MKPEEEQLLRQIVGEKLTHIKNAQNILENSMWSNMIDGALKGLEIVAIASLDWKLTGIVKLLQSWLKDKREDKQKREQQELYGTGYKAPEEVPYDPWSSTYY